MRHRQPGEGFRSRHSSYSLPIPSHTLPCLDSTEIRQGSLRCGLQIVPREIPECLHVRPRPFVATPTSASVSRVPFSAAVMALFWTDGGVSEEHEQGLKCWQYFRAAFAAKLGSGCRWSLGRPVGQRKRPHTYTHQCAKRGSEGGSFRGSGTEGLKL